MTTLEWKDVLSPGIAAFAFLISVLAFRLNKQVAALSRKPVLVFIYDNTRGWILKNVGSGPALNVIVAKRRDEWFCPVRVPPMGKDAEFIPLWLDHVNDVGLGATYTDSENKPYTSITANDWTKMYEGTRFGPWRDEQKIGRHWEENPCKR